MADAADSKSAGETRGSSTLPFGTIQKPRNGGGTETREVQTSRVSLCLTTMLTTKGRPDNPLNWSSCPEQFVHTVSCLSLKVWDNVTVCVHGRTDLGVT